MTPSDWVSLAGAVVGGIGFVASWIKLQRVWRDRWPDEELFPLLQRARRGVRRAGRWLVERFRRRHVGGFATSGLIVGSSSASGRARVHFDADRPIEERMLSIEKFLEHFQESVTDRFDGVRREMVHAIAEVTDEHRAQLQANDEDAREQLRTALGWPALLIFLGVMLQVVALPFP